MKPTVTIIFLVMLFNTLSWAQRKKGADYYFEQGEAALDDNKHALALDHFTECIRLDPYFWEAYAERASAKEALGDIKGALSDYSIFVDANPNNSEALFSRASLRYQTGHYATAKEDFTRLLTLPTGTTNKIFFRMDPFGGGADKAFTAQSTTQATIHNYLGLIEMKLKNYAKASIHFDSAIRLDGHDPQLFVNRGILKEHLKDSSGAMTDYEEALLRDPAFGLAIHNIAVIKRTRGQEEESEQLLNDAIKHNPNLPYPYSARAYYHLKRKNLSKALDDYNNVLELNKEDEEAWLYRGLVKENLNDKQGAFADYTQAISLKIDFPKAWLARANLLRKQKRFKDALEDYTAAITWNDEYGQAYLYRALAHEQLGDLKSACDDIVMAEKFKVKINETVKDRVCIIATKNK